MIMSATHQIYPVNKSRQVVIQLPPDFQGHEISVSWKPVIDKDEQSRQALADLVRGWNTTGWLTEKLKARDELIEFILTEWDLNGSRVMDMLSPFIEEVDWLTEPLPKEMQDYFYGSLTDEYGMTLET